jgi:transposase
MGVRSPKVQDAKQKADGERHTLDKSHNDKAQRCDLAAYCGNVVESAERNPIVKPEKKHLKQLQSETNDLDTLVCGEDLFRHFRIRRGKCRSEYLEAVTKQNLFCCSLRGNLERRCYSNGVFMATPLLPNALWNLIEPLLPTPASKPKGGRPRLSDRACLKGVLFVLRSGIPWRMLPKQMNCGSGMTCWRRLRDWQNAGTWQLIHFSLLDWLARYGRIDWSRAVLDSCSIRAVFGGFKQVLILPTEPNSVASVI